MSDAVSNESGKTLWVRVSRERALRIARMVESYGASDDARYLEDAKECDDHDALTQQLAQLQAQNTALLAREKLLEGALKKFAEFPLKDFGGRNNPNHPIYGFNEWVLRVRHIDAARALLRPSGGEGEK